MPLLNGKEVVFLPNPSSEISNSCKIFQIRFTGEIFSNYDDYCERLAFYRQPQFSCQFSGKSGLSFESAMDCETKTKKEIFEQIPAEIVPFVLRQIELNKSKLKMGDLVNYICANSQIAATKKAIRCAIRMFGGKTKQKQKQKQKSGKTKQSKEERARKWDLFWSKIEQIGIVNDDYLQKEGLNEANLSNMAFFDFYSFFDRDADHRTMNDLFCRIWRLWTFFVVFCGKVRISPFPISFFLDALMTEKRCFLLDEMYRCLLQIIDINNEQNKYFKLDSLRSYLLEQRLFFECDKLSNLRDYASLSLEQKLNIFDILFEGAIKSEKFGQIMAEQMVKNEENLNKIKKNEDAMANYVKNEKKKLKMLRNEEKNENENLIKERRKLFDAEIKAKKCENAQIKYANLRESGLYFLELGMDETGNRYFWSKHGDGRIFIFHSNAFYHGVESENDYFCWSIVSKLAHFYDLLSILNEGKLRQNVNILKKEIIESMALLQNEEKKEKEEQSLNGLRRSKRATKKQKEAKKDFTTYKNLLK